MVLVLLVLLFIFAPNKVIIEILARVIPLLAMLKELFRIPELDLHNKRREEALHATKNFVEEHRGYVWKVHCITGRGLHSYNGVPILKPAIISLLNNCGDKFRETAMGGRLEVFTYMHPWWWGQFILVLSFGYVGFSQLVEKVLDHDGVLG